MKKRILFVDDESRVLAGLRRMLYPLRNEWDMTFAGSGREALSILENGEEYDAIVSDMRMPDIDGSELLNTVKERYPNMVRFILSGYSDRDMILRTIGSTDQFLTKPCDPEMLKETLNKAFEAQKMVDKRRIQKMVSGMKNLPTLPDLYLKLREVLSSSKSSFRQIADIVSQDVTVTAKVLQLVNSAFFGLRHRIENIQHAVTYLGLETLKAVVLTADVFSKFSEQEIERFNVRELYRHSISVGVLGKKIAETISSDKLFIDEVGMIGILHDIGQVVFIRNKAEEYYELLQANRQMPMGLYAFEEKRFGISHAELGGYLMSLWGLPENIVNAISFHHHPTLGSKTQFSGTTAVYVANILDHEPAWDIPQTGTAPADGVQQPGVPGNEPQQPASVDESILHDLSGFDVKYLETLGITNNIALWRKMCQNMKAIQRGENGIN